MVRRSTSPFFLTYFEYTRNKKLFQQKFYFFIIFIIMNIITIGYSQRAISISYFQYLFNTFFLIQWITYGYRRGQGIIYMGAGYTLAYALFGCNVPSLDPKGYGSEIP